MKEIVASLNDMDRAILIMYADLGSMEKTGKKFGVSGATIYAHIVRIREIIKSKL